jgi:hypothetical protein
MCLVTLALLCGGAAFAQTEPDRHRRGLWGEFGAGPGYVFGASGTTSMVRIGGVISKNVLISFELFTTLNKTFAFAPEDSNAVAETGTAAIVLLWYPGRRGLFFKGGVGAAFGQFSVPADSASGGSGGSGAAADTSNGGGIGLTFGLGWDVPISRKFAITANAAAFVTAVGDIVLPGRRVDDVIATTYQASIGFTIR